jgi:hypothetical protein
MMWCHLLNWSQHLESWAKSINGSHGKQPNLHLLFWYSYISGPHSTPHCFGSPRLIVRLPAIPSFISLLRHPLGSCTCMGAHPSQPLALHILTPVSFQIHCLIQRSWYRMGEEGHICLVCLGHIALLSLAMEVRSTRSDDYPTLSILLCPIDGGRGHELDPLDAGKSRGFLSAAWITKVGEI